MKRIVFFIVIIFSLNSFSQENRVQLIEHDFEEELSIVVEVDKTKKKLKYRRYY